MPNIHTISSSRDEDSKKDKEQLVGGGATSSTAVFRGNQPGNSGNPMDALVNKARSQQNQPVPQQSVGNITIYKNGFIVGDGEFRDRKLAKNEQFLQALMRGESPPELQEEAIKAWGPQTDSVAVQLVNKSSEDYVPPPEKFSFAKSQGRSLASSSTSSAQRPVVALSAREYKVAPSAPKGNIQLVMKPRRRVVVSMNHDSTVGQLVQHVMFLTSTSNFQLYTGYPPKALSDMSVTVKDAGLIGASVEVR